jgi:hypothetical protein
MTQAALSDTDYKVTNWPGAVALAPGKTLTLTIAFTPTSAAPCPATFTVLANGNASASVSLNGTGLASSTTTVTPLTITTTSLPGGTVATAYSATLGASGGTAPYSWSVTSGSLPPGLTLASTGAISGTPTTSGSYPFTVQVRDSATTAQTSSATFSISVGVTAPTITTTSLPNATVNSAYSATLTASGGVTPYTWSLISGALPAGMTLGSTGVISGTPTTAATYSFTIQVKDSESTPQTASKALSITVATTAPKVTTTSLPNATVNTAYSATLAGSGGTTPYTWKLTGGALPSGLSLSSTGTISGTPTASGTFSFTVQLTDATGQTASATLGLTVASSSSSGAIFFASTSFINTLLPSSPSVDPNSATMVANSIAAEASQAHLSNGGYGTGLVYSHSTDKVYSVKCTTYDSNTCKVGSSVNFPIPKGVTVPSGTDHNTAFVYMANDGSPYAGMELDCWIAQYSSSTDTWSCGTASIVKNQGGWGTCANANIQGYHCNGGYAAGFDFAAGPVRPEEIAAGYIPHALVAAIPNTGSGIICPATHTDHSGTGIPEGGHFFLPQSYNVDAQSWPAWVKMIAHALQNYGGYIVDYGGAFEIKGFTDQNTTINGGITWSSVGVPMDQGGDLSMLPWNQMQVVTMVSCN